MSKYIIKFKETSREEELEFYSNKFLSEKRYVFNSIEDTKDFPLIQQIFYLPFVKKVVLNKSSIYIEKLNILNWIKRKQLSGHSLCGKYTESKCDEICYE